MVLAELGLCGAGRSKSERVEESKSGRLQGSKGEGVGGRLGPREAVERDEGLGEVVGREEG
jgi:hypothetical protein